jgi:hypothetical protein
MADKNLEQRIIEARDAGYSQDEIKTYLIQKGGYTEQEIQPYMSPQASEPAGPPMLEAPDMDAKRREEQVATTQLGTALGAGGLATAGLGYGAYRGARSLINQYNQGRPAPAAPAAAPTPAAMPTPAQASASPATRVNISPQAQMMSELARPGVAPPMNEMPRPSTPPAPGIAPQAVPAPQAPGMMDRFAQMAQQYAPILAKAAPVAKAAGAVGALTYSPGLNTGEQDELIRQRVRIEAARKAGLIQ